MSFHYVLFHLLCSTTETLYYTFYLLVLAALKQKTNKQLFVTKQKTFIFWVSKEAFPNFFLSGQRPYQKWR